MTVRQIALRFALMPMAIALMGGALAQERFILRYEQNEGLNGYLVTRGLKLLKQIPGQPIYLVERVMLRASARRGGGGSVIQDEPHLEPDQTVWIPEALNQESVIDTFEFLLDALNNRRPADYYGSQAIAGFADQPTSRQTQATLNRDVNGQGTGVVGVIDTGSDPEHPFLVGSLVPGFDFTRDLAGFAPETSDLTDEQRTIMSPSGDSWDSMELYEVNPTTTPLLERGVAEFILNNPLPKAFGHGTMVKGAIRLVSPGARLMPLKAFRGDGSGSLFDVLRAIYFAQSRGVKVLNMSMSSRTYSLELERAIDFVSTHGVICVASVGNDGIETDSVYPAALGLVLGIASVSPGDRRSRFTNVGSSLVSFAAPGEGLLLPFPGDRWAGGWGTSFAAPLVSGTIASILSYRADADLGLIRSALQNGVAMDDSRLGAARIDAYRAVSSLR